MSLPSFCVSCSEVGSSGILDRKRSNFDLKTPTTFLCRSFFKGENIKKLRYSEVQAIEVLKLTVLLRSLALCSFQWQNLVQSFPGSSRCILCHISPDFALGSRVLAVNFTL